MSGRQRTFDLVPTTLVHSKGHVPPMTSKAAKKAHREANRLPKISRAEQRRLEQEEREAQRKEYEKERAAAKAKAAREKKADKAAADRALRKKAGIPEPSKYVRPSQPTISMFVRTGAKRSWKEMDSGEDSIPEEGHAEVENGDAIEDRIPEGKYTEEESRGASGDSIPEEGHTEGKCIEEAIIIGLDKNVKDIEDLDAIYEQIVGEETVTEDQVSGVQQLASQVRNIGDTVDLLACDIETHHEKTSPSVRKVAVIDSDDEFGDFPCWSQSDIPRLFEEANVSINLNEGVGNDIPAAVLTAKDDSCTSREVKESRKLPDLKLKNAEEDDDEFPFDDMMLEDLVATQLRSEAECAANKTQNPTKVQKQVLIPPKPTRGAFSRPSFPAVKRPYIASTRPAARSIPWEADKRVIPEVRTVHGHRVAQDHTIGHDGSVNQNHTLRQAQTVQQNHTVSRGHTVSEEHTVKQGHTLQQAHTFDQAPSRSSKPPPLRPLSVARTINSMPPPAIPIKKPRSVSFAPSPVKPDRSRPMLEPISKPALNLPPSATQAFLADHFDDFFPSPSQQVRELDKDINELPSNTQIARELLSEEPTNEPIVPNEKKDDFELFMCTQDLVMSSQDILEIESPCAKQPVHPKPPTPPRPAKRKRFFEEKEEDLLAAALHESRILAEKQKTLDTSLRGGAVYEELFWEEDTSKNLSRGRNNSTTTRKLQRVLSAASDYGDDFSGCSQELRDAVEDVESSAKALL